MSPVKMPVKPMGGISRRRLFWWSSGWGRDQAWEQVLVPSDGGWPIKLSSWKLSWSICDLHLLSTDPANSCSPGAHPETSGCLSVTSRGPSTVSTFWIQLPSTTAAGWRCLQIGPGENAQLRGWLNWVKGRVNPCWVGRAEIQSLPLVKSGGGISSACHFVGKGTEPLVHPSVCPLSHWTVVIEHLVSAKS